jgi:hypothetical protein
MATHRDSGSTVVRPHPVRGGRGLIQVSATGRRSSSTTASPLLLALVILLNWVVQGEDVVFLRIGVSPLKVFQQCGAAFQGCLVPLTPACPGESAAAWSTVAGAGVIRRLKPKSVGENAYRT